MGLGLKTDYKDDVLDVEKNTKRKYKTSYDSMGLLSLDDVTEYTQVGDSFGAKELNETNKKINDFHNELENYIPLSDTNVTLKKGGMLAPNGDIYINDNGKWVSSMLNDINVNLLKLNKGLNINVPGYNDFGEDSDTPTYFKNVLKWICTNYPEVTGRTWMFNGNPNSTGWCAVYIYNTDDTIDGLPRYACGIHIPLNKNAIIFKYGCIEGEYYYIDFIKNYLTPSNFIVSGSADSATLTINLD